MSIEELKELKSYLYWSLSECDGPETQFDRIIPKRLSQIFRIIDAEIQRKENRDYYETEADHLVKGIANRRVPIDEDFMKIVGESAHIWDFIIDLLLTHPRPKLCEYVPNPDKLSKCPECGKSLNLFAMQTTDDEWAFEYHVAVAVKFCPNCGREVELTKEGAND